MGLESDGHIVGEDHNTLTLARLALIHSSLFSLKEVGRALRLRNRPARLHTCKPAFAVALAREGGD
jgi:hypothetical protein